MAIKIPIDILDLDGNLLAGVSAPTLTVSIDHAPLVTAEGAWAAVGNGHYVYTASSDELAAVTENLLVDVAPLVDTYRASWGRYAVPGSLAALAAIRADLVDIGGLLHRNSMMDKAVYVGNFLVSARLRVFADAAALAAATAGAPDNTNGELRRYALAGVNNGSGHPSSFKATRQL